MPYLDKFTEEERDLLVSLPFRTGVWVSHSDDSGGDESAEAEMEAMRGIIMGYAEDFLKSEFVEELMRQTLARRDQWDVWGKGLETVPEECRKAAVILGRTLERKDILSFKQTLMEIATSVAMAYREFGDDTPLTSRLRVYSRYYWRVFMARLKKEQEPSLDEILNISMAEETVLVQLAAALQVDMEGNPLNKAQAA